MLYNATAHAPTNIDNFTFVLNGSYGIVIENTRQLIWVQAPSLNTTLRFYVNNSLEYRITDENNTALPFYVASGNSTGFRPTEAWTTDALASYSFENISTAHTVGGVPEFKDATGKFNLTINLSSIRMASDENHDELVGDTFWIKEACCSIILNYSASQPGHEDLYLVDSNFTISFFGWFASSGDSSSIIDAINSTSQVGWEIRQDRASAGLNFMQFRWHNETNGALLNFTLNWSVMPTSQWTHFALVHAESLNETRWYINGSIVNNLTNQEIKFNTTTRPDIFIGVKNNEDLDTFSDNFPNGGTPISFIDELRIYDSVKDSDWLKRESQYQKSSIENLIVGSVNASIVIPNGTESSATEINFKFLTNRTRNLDTCRYNVSKGATIDVSNTVITCNETMEGTFDLDLGDGEYTIGFFSDVFSEETEDHDTKTFTLGIDAGSGSTSGGGGGGGGGAPLQTIVPPAVGSFIPGNGVCEKDLGEDFFSGKGDCPPDLADLFKRENITKVGLALLAISFVTILFAPDRRKRRSKRRKRRRR